MTAKAAQLALERRRTELRQRLGLEALPETGSQGDEADEVAARELRVVAFATRDQMAASLRAIDEALDRIAAGTFGLCLGCQSAISPGRLRALPWAAFCVGCQVLREQQAASLDRPPLRARVSEQPGDNDGLQRRDVTPPDQAMSEIEETDRWTEADRC